MLSGDVSYVHEDVVFWEQSQSHGLYNNFGYHWIRVMGLTSEMQSAPSFFGSNAILAMFMTWKLLIDSSEKALMRLIRSSLMMMGNMCGNQFLV